MKLLGKKVLSYIIDYGIIILISQLFFFCANVFFLNPETQNQAIMMLLCALITVLLLTSYIPTQLNGQTIGQKVMKLRVTNMSGKKRTYVQSFLRECVIKVTLGPVFIIFTFCYFVINNLILKHDPDNELPHDFILKTKIVCL